MMICKTCNKYIPDDSKFCPYCGSNNLGNDEFSKSAGFISKTISKAAKIKEVSIKSILLAITMGIWILVLQNLGIIPINQNVRVTNEVEIEGDVDVNNTVDVNVVGY